jgi:hypothetical protein
LPPYDVRQKPPHAGLKKAQRFLDLRDVGLLRQKDQFSRGSQKAVLSSLQQASHWHLSTASMRGDHRRMPAG